MPTDNRSSSLVRMMVWCHTGDHDLNQRRPSSLLTHIWVNMPQWVSRSMWVCDHNTFYTFIRSMIHFYNCRHIDFSETLLTYVASTYQPKLWNACKRSTEKMGWRKIKMSSCSPSFWGNFIISNAHQTIFYYNYISLENLMETLW